MDADLLLRRKWTFKAHGKQMVFVKRAKEQNSHVLMKALLWALYLPEYPELSVEIAIGDRYKPDVVACTPYGYPIFWGEAGKVGSDKIRSLAQRYRHTHFVLAKWNVDLAPFRVFINKALAGLCRTAPLDLISFPANSAERFIDRHGCIRLSHAALQWTRIS